MPSRWRRLLTKTRRTAKYLVAQPVVARNVGVTVTFDVVQEPGEALVPPLGVRVPRPAVEVLQPVFAIGAEGAFDERRVAC